MQPLMINITGKKIIIIGGGKIAARKGHVLAKENPEITFIAPQFSDDVRSLAAEKGYSLIEREAAPSDLAGAFLVVLATNDRQINESLANATEPNQLVCVVDQAEKGNVLFPAAIKRGHLQIAISSGGASPKLTRKLKKEWEAQLDESWTAYTNFLAECRSIIKTLPLSFEEKDKWLAKLLDDRYRKSKELQEKEIGRLRGMKKSGL